MNASPLKELLETFKSKTAIEMGWFYARQSSAPRVELMQDLRQTSLDINLNLDLITPHPEVSGGLSHE